MKRMILIVLVVAGCRVERVSYAVPVENHAVVTTQRPPEPRDETQYAVAPPTSDYVWSSGYWQWTGMSWVWMPGRWVVAPEPGLVYVRPGWVVVHGSYRWVPGRWSRPSYAPSYRYVYPTRSYRTVTPRRRF